MTVIISGSAGIQNVLGSAASPAESNTTNSNTGMYFPTSTTLGFSTAGTNAVTIDASQKVLIGNTTSPSSASMRLLVANPSGDGYAQFANNSSGGGAVGSAGGAGLIFYGYTGVVGSETYTERARIDSSGNVGIGTNSPSARLQLQGSGATNPLLINNGTTAGDVGVASILIYKYDNNTTTSQIFQKFVINNGANGSGSITANGASNAAFTAFSDQRLKENIVDLPSQLANIMALRPVEFDYIESVGGGHQIGFIAQEVQTVYPDLVGVGENEMLTLTDMNKNDARLIKCIQEQQALITQLTDRIAALEAR